MIKEEISQLKYVAIEVWEHFTLLLEWLGQEAWGSDIRSSWRWKEGQGRLSWGKRALKGKDTDKL